MYTVLKKLRKKLDLKQHNIAKKLCLTTSAYAKIEQGVNRLVDAHYTPLAEIFDIPRNELVDLYLSETDTLPTEERISLKLNISQEVNFGTVEALDYMYINMAQGPDFLQFKLSKEAAKPFIDKIDFDYNVINNALKQIEPNREDIAYAIHEIEEDDNDVEYEVFTAYLLDTVEINGIELPPGPARYVLDYMEAETFKVVCSLVCEDSDFGEVFQLRLDSLEFESEHDILDYIPIIPQFNISDLPEELYYKVLLESDSISSVSQLIKLAKEHDFELGEKDARSLLKQIL